MLIDRNVRFSDQAIIEGRSAFAAAIDALPLRHEQREPYSIQPEKIVIVEKKSRWELDQEKYQLDHAALEDFYAQAGITADRVYQSHLAQVQARASIKQVFPEAIIVGRDQIEQAVSDPPSLLIALGGDNHAQWVSHWIVDQTPFIGINSDPQNSVGALLQTSSANLPQLRSDLLAGNYEFLPYTRIKVSLNGVQLPLALSEVFIGDKYRMNISRYYIETNEIGGESKESKDSGLLIATGSGSTGWFRSSVRAQYHFSPQFEPTVAGAAYQATESSMLSAALQTGVIKVGAELKITSRFNRSGVISIDSDEEMMIEFPRGSVAVVALDAKPLWIVAPKR